MMNGIAATNNVDKINMERLRGVCIRELKKTNGILSFDDACDRQEE